MGNTEVTRYDCARETALQGPDRRKTAAVMLAPGVGKTPEQFQQIKAGPPSNEVELLGGSGQLLAELWMCEADQRVGALGRGQAFEVCVGYTPLDPKICL
jgi:hypothetical protein